MAGQRVGVVSPGGELGYVDEDELSIVLGAGYRHQNAEEVAAEDERETFKDRPIAAGTAGLLRGATLGLSDAVAEGAGIASGPTLAGLREHNEGVSMGTEVLGSVLPAVIPGGQWAPAGAAARLGVGAAKATAGVVGKGVAGRIISTAVGAGVENSLFGAGTAYSEATLGESDVTGEKLLSMGGMGFLWGGAAGAGFSGAGALLKGGGKAALKAVAGRGDDFAGAVAAAADPAAARAAGVATEATEAAGDGWLKGSAKKFMAALDLDLPTAENWVLKDLNVNKKGNRQLWEKKLNVAAPKALLDDPRYANAKHLEEKVALLDVKRNEYGLEISDAISKFDAAAKPSERFNATDVVAKIRKEVLAPLVDGPALNDPIIAKIEKELERLEEKGGRGITFVKAEKIKRDFDPYLAWDSVEPGPMKNALRDVRGIVKSEIEAKAKLIADRTGNKADFDAWKMAKKNYGGMKQLGDSAHEGMLARKTNRNLSLTDNMAGMAAFVAGGLNPVGIALGVGGALLNKWGRERLPHILALETNKLGKDALVDIVAAQATRLADDAGLRKVADAFAVTMKKDLHPDTVSMKAPVAGMPPPIPPPPKFGPYTKILQNAAASGPYDLFVTHAALMIADAAYGPTMAAAGIIPETDEETMTVRRKASHLESIEGALATQTERVSKAIRSEPSQVAARTKKAKPTAETFERRTQEIAHLVSSPTALADVMAEVTGPLADSAPAAAVAMTAAASRAVEFLASKMRTPPPAGLLAPDWTPSDAEIAKFDRYDAATNNPLIILDEIEAGLVRPETLETLQIVYPALYRDVQKNIIEYLSEKPKNVAYSRRVMLSLVAGVDADGTMNKASIQASQAVFNRPSAKGPEDRAGGGAVRPSQAGASKLNIAGRSLTSMQATTQRNER